MADLSGLDEDFAELKKLNQEVVCSPTLKQTLRRAN
jgi:hypothetical protein